MLPLESKGVVMGGKIPCIFMAVTTTIARPRPAVPKGGIDATRLASDFHRRLDSHRARRKAELVVAGLVRRVDLDLPGSGGGCGRNPHGEAEGDLAFVKLHLHVEVGVLDRLRRRSFDLTGKLEWLSFADPDLGRDGTFGQRLHRVQMPALFY